MFARNKKSKKRGAVRSQPSARRAPVIRLRYLLLMAVFGLLATGAWQLRQNLDSRMMAFEHVNIGGEFVQLAPRAVEQVVQANLDGDYFTLDLDRMRDALLELPWIEEVSVRRRWPSGLDIIVQEKQAIAYWGDKRLLSDRGEVFEPTDRVEGLNIPRLQGPEGLHGQVWQFYVDVSNRLVAFDNAIAELVLDDRRSWRMRLHNGLSIRLGRDQIDDRLQRLYQVFAMRTTIDIASIEQIDMRYPNGFAVRFSVAKQSGDKDNSASENAASKHNMDGVAGSLVKEV